MTRQKAKELLRSTSTLRPGLLVSVKTSIVGNVSYDKKDIEREKKTASGAKVAVWETKRTIVDPEEYELAHTSRMKALTTIRSVCAHSAFGLLCPEDKVEELADKIAEAREIVEEFNAKARMTRANVFVMTGRIAPDDVEAIRAINSEISDLQERMEKGLANLDVKAVREAAQKARSVGMMLSPNAQENVKAAIEMARKEATRLNKAGETAAVEVDKAVLRKLKQLRTAFLDTDEIGKVQAPKAKSRAVDFDPTEKPTRIKTTRGKQTELELGE